MITLGMMDSGICPSNMTQLHSVLDILNYKSLNGRFFKNIELTIGRSLRKVAIDLMEKPIEKEVRLTLNDKKIILKIQTR